MKKCQKKIYVIDLVASEVDDAKKLRSGVKEFSGQNSKKKIAKSVWLNNWGLSR